MTPCIASKKSKHMYSVPMQAQNKENWQSIILPSEGLKRNCKNDPTLQLQMMQITITTSITYEMS
jgi:hypothetical protein